jgi:quercetin dioxygenase-like cupin family protein
MDDYHAGMVRGHDWRNIGEVRARTAKLLFPMTMIVRPHHASVAGWHPTRKWSRFANISRSSDASLVELEGREELETASMDARTPLQPAVVTPKQALSIKPFGLDMDVLLTTEATGGATSVIVAWHKPGEGPPDHVHFKQEEILFIIEGLYEVTVGDETTKAGPGSIVFIPRNVVHRFKNVDDIMGRMLGWSLPGG